MRERLAGLPERTEVVFTAHSLPERVLEDDPYPEQLRASASAIAEAAGVAPSSWSIGWQSAGRTPEPWRGPDILDIIAELAEVDRADGVLVVPQGFTSDHLEVLYDLDIEAAAAAAEVRARLRPHRGRQRRSGGHGRAGAADPRARRPSGVNPPTRRLVVIGGGITGLAAAWEASAHEDVGITVLEATDRLGGKIHTSDVVLEDDTTMRLDEGADAFLARVPDGVELCHELGLGGELTQPAVGRAKLAIDGELVFLPAETVLGVPVDGESLRGRGVLSDDAVDAVAAELERHGPPPQGDVAIGPFLSERLHPEVVEHLVSPLVGGINAGDVDQLSLAAVTPQLAEAAADGDSLVAALARRRVPATSDAPVFHGLLAGTGRLVDRLAEALTARGVQIRTGAPVDTLGDLLDDSTVAVVATPAPVAAGLLGPVSAEAAEELAASSTARSRS